MSELTVELRHGYTLTDLHDLSKVAALTSGPHGADFLHQYGLAWSAIAEALYAADQAPLGRDLIAAGRAAIWQDLNQSTHCHGLVQAPHGGHHVGHNVERFWNHYRVTPSHEDAIVDRLALTQILPTLSETQRQTVTAFAAADCSRDRARKALGINAITLTSRLTLARRRFLTLWHEGEKPSGKWRHQYDLKPAEQLVPCGTESSYMRHWHRNEHIDDACRQAHSDHLRAYRARKKAEAAA